MRARVRIDLFRSNLTVPLNRERYPYYAEMGGVDSGGRCKQRGGGEGERWGEESLWGALVKLSVSRMDLWSRTGGTWRQVDSWGLPEETSPPLHLPLAPRRGDGGEPRASCSRSWDAASS